MGVWRAPPLLHRKAAPYSSRGLFAVTGGWGAARASLGTVGRQLDLLTRSKHVPTRSGFVHCGSATAHGGQHVRRREGLWRGT
eukprot:6820298-Prymnesium_polylepis.1